MGLTLDEVKAIKEDFKEEYFSSKGITGGIYSQYRYLLRISDLKTQKDIFLQKLDLKDGETLEDLCLSVQFIKQPPKSLFPDEYKGVRIFYHVCNHKPCK